MHAGYSIVSSPFQKIFEQLCADASSTVVGQYRKQQELGFVDHRAEKRKSD